MTSKSPSIRPSGQPSQTQRGVALIVSLILLLIVTVIGLAAIRSTTLQEKMASNLQDRQIALQNTEAALRIAQGLLQANTATVWRDCTVTSTQCDNDPSSQADAAGAWQTVASGTGANQYTAGSNAVGQPQYVIEDMGRWNDRRTALGPLQTANSAQYGAAPVMPTAHFFRITARSADPATAPDRATVTLQAWVRQ
ncbi:MAG: pilus assembly PilX family protein [Thiomonas sp.]